MSDTRPSREELARLRRRLDRRGLAIISQVAELRLMSGAQIAAKHFPPESHDSSAAAARAARRCLASLTAKRLLVRAGRQVGGVRAGSSGYIYALGPVGQRLIEMNGPRRRFREPSATFADHTLAVSQLVVDLTLAARAGRFDILAVEAEPACWRAFGGISGRQVLRPDLFVSLGVEEYERRYFVEVDRGNEHLPALVRKCRTYEAYYRSGSEQAKHEVFPRVCWLMPSSERAERLQQVVDGAKWLTEGLFLVLPNDQAIEGLTGGGR